jgi:glycosyltransferase involved in cell wall biosynthesis
MFRDRLRLPPDRFVVVPNGAQLPPLDQTIPVSKDRDVILSVGRLERYKGHQKAIAAMPHVLSERPEARLRIIGSGPYEEELRALAGRLGIAERVGFRTVGGSDRQGMAVAFAQSALVVLLSDYEAHPISVMEALSLGRPVLVTYTSGLAELADRGLVRAIPVSASASDVASSILHNLADPLIPPVTTLPSWDDCTRSLSQVYESVLSTRTPPAVVG